MVFIFYILFQLIYFRVNRSKQQICAFIARFYRNIVGKRFYRKNQRGIFIVAYFEISCQRLIVTFGKIGTNKI